MATTIGKAGIDFHIIHLLMALPASLIMAAMSVQFPVMQLRARNDKGVSLTK